MSPTPRKQAQSREATPVASAGVVQPEPAPEGWAVGNAAPEDRFIELDHTGAQVGKPGKSPADGYGRQLVVKGDIVTAEMRAQLGLDD